MNTQEIIQEFKKELERLGYSKNMTKTFPVFVLELLEQTKKQAQFITSKDIWDHYEYLKQRPKQRQEGLLSDSMIQSHLFGIKLFFIYWQRLERIEVHPMSALVFPRKKGKVRVTLTESEIKQLYEVSTTRISNAILSIYYGCGLRRSEGMALNIRDISFKQNLLYVREGKGAKRRVVPMSDQVAKHLKDYYLKERNQCITVKTKGTHEQAFLLSSAGTRMSTTTISKRLKELLKRAELDETISLHNLRHSIATHLLNRGMSLEYVRDFLGHSSLETTQIYTKVNQRKLDEL